MSRRIDLAQRKVDKDENVNGRRGTLRNQRRRPERPQEPGPSHSGSGSNDIRVSNFFVVKKSTKQYQKIFGNINFDVFHRIVILIKGIKYIIILYLLKIKKIKNY